ncbi:hypothetical protein E2562_017066 [Oryza meyeriana var. granulata]|uniref:Uncharacterized protein n=1 Tax=Oryza meyeriana var. granulata TaxID=110450 RepID=A0A6G1F8M1_9ORYZ|nr:hypothetical protein E2562_017066 [Oryza meyeriana var. granulata]
MAAAPGRRLRMVPPVKLGALVLAARSTASCAAHGLAAAPTAELVALLLRQPLTAKLVAWLLRWLSVAELTAVVWDNTPLLAKSGHLFAMAEVTAILGPACDESRRGRRPQPSAATRDDDHVAVELVVLAIFIHT